MLKPPIGDPRDESIADLVGRVADDARAYARAEVELLREIARHRAGRARTGAILLCAGLVLLFGALIALVLGLVGGLATLIHPLFAGIVVALLFALGGFLLVRIGLSGLGALAGDEDERKAIERGGIVP